MRRTKQSINRGFTIVELVIIIAVIGILATIGIISWSGAQNKARKTNFQANSEQVKLKLGEYFTENSRYPKNRSSVCSYLQATQSTSLYTEVCTGPNNGAYGYTATPTGCYDAADTPTNTPACTTYTISVTKSNWNGAASESDISITP